MIDFVPDYFAQEADRGKIGKQEEGGICPVCGIDGYFEDEICNACGGDCRNLK